MSAATVRRRIRGSTTPRLVVLAVVAVMSFGTRLSVASEAAPTLERTPLVFKAPFVMTTGLGYMASGSCTSSSGAVRPLYPDAESGKIDHSEGASVEDCTFLRGGLTERWNVGEVPERLIGRPGRVLLKLEARSIRLIASGAPARSSAQGSLSLGSSTWTTAAVNCVAGTCRREQVKTLAGTKLAILEARFDALPEVLELVIDRSFMIDSGNGSIGIEFRGLLKEVTLIPVPLSM